MGRSQLLVTACARLCDTPDDSRAQTQCPHLTEEATGHTWSQQCW